MADKLPYLSDAHHFAIAAVASRAAQLEAHIEIAIHALLKETPNAAAFILKNMNGDRYVGLLEALLLDRFGETGTAGIEDLFTQIRAARTERNEILHWIWGKTLEGNEEEAVHALMRPFRNAQVKRKTAADIQAVAQQMLNLSTSLFAWTKLALTPRSSQQTPEPQSPQHSLLWPSADGHVDIFLTRPPPEGSHQD